MRTLVLGCATGIGNAGARLLAARGDRLALGDIDGPASLRWPPSSVPRRTTSMPWIPLPCRDSSMPRRRSSGASTTSGRTSACRSAGSVEQASLEDFDRSFAINVRGACRRLRRGRAASARRGRRRDLHHGIQLRAALGTEARPVCGHQGRGARTGTAGRPRLQRARASASTPSARAGSTRPSTRRVGELRRARALPRGGAAARAARAHRHAGRGRAAGLLPALRRRRRT